MMKIEVRRVTVARNVYVIADGCYADEDEVFSVKRMVTYQELEQAQFKGALLFDVERRLVFELMTRMQQATTD